MKKLTLTISKIERLHSIQKSLTEKEPLTAEQTSHLIQLLTRIPASETLLTDMVPLEESLEVNCWDMQKLEEKLKKWINLFENTPGYDYASSCYVVGDDNMSMLNRNIIMIATFAPSLAYNSLEKNEGYEVHLKDNGTAVFWFPTFEDAEKYPELYNFNGSWREAYYLLIETLKKGWPMEEFPEELLPLLKR